MDSVCGVLERALAWPSVAMAQWAVAVAGRRRCRSSRTG